MEGYNDGIWWIQDLSSMMPIYLLNNIQNKKIADLCSAPGGKALQLASKGAIVTAFEKKYKRAELIKKNMERLKLKCNIVVKDVLKINDKQKFDVVILDAPCSSVGTIRRHPEIFFREKSPNFKKITALQKSLLNKAKNLLKKNGLLVYIVCSFLNEEGKYIIKEFLDNNKNYNLDKFSIKKDEAIYPFIDKEGFYYVLPNELKNGILIDGFFAAKLKRND